MAGGALYGRCYRFPKSPWTKLTPSEKGEIQCHFARGAQRSFNTLDVELLVAMKVIEKLQSLAEKTRKKTVLCEHLSGQASFWKRRKLYRMKPQGRCYSERFKSFGRKLVSANAITSAKTLSSLSCDAINNPGLSISFAR